jgi:hypothetical protein
MQFIVKCQRCKNILKAEVKGISGQKKVIDQAGWKQVSNVGMICDQCIKVMFQKVG